MNKEAKMYGLYLGVISIALSGIMYALDLAKIGDQNPVQTFLSLAITVVFMVLAGLAFKKRNEGFMSFGEGFKTTLGAGILGAIIGMAWFVVMITVLEPNYQEQILDATYEQMITQNPDMSDDQIDIAVSMTEKFTSPGWMITFGLFGAVILNLVLALIVALVLKKNRPIFGTLDSDSAQ